MASLAIELAMTTPRVTAEVIEVSEFPELAQGYQVSVVPRTVINDAVVFDGALPESIFLDAILQAVGKPPLVDQGGGPVIEEVDTGDQGGVAETEEQPGLLGGASAL